MPRTAGRQRRAAPPLPRKSCAGSTGSCSSSPTCRPDSARSSRSISPRRNGRRSTSASCCRSAAWSRCLAQIPGGALVDAARSERLVAGIAVAAIARSALAYAAWPIFPVDPRGRRAARRRELRARALHRRDQPRARRPCGDRRTARAQRALCLDRQRLRGGRHGRRRLFLSPHARFSSSRPRCSIPTAARAAPHPPGEIDPERAHGGPVARKPDHAPVDVRTLLRKRPLLILAGCVAAVPSRQRRDAAADGQRADQALQRMGDDADRGLHRGAADRRRG